MPISLDSVVAVADNVLFQPVGGGAVLLNLETERYFSLNEIGTLMWQAFVAGETPRHFCQKLVSEYSVDCATCQADALRLIADLIAAGLLHGSTSEP